MSFILFISNMGEEGKTIGGNPICSSSNEPLDRLSNTRTRMYIRKENFYKVHTPINN